MQGVSIAASSLRSALQSIARRPQYLRQVLKMRYLIVTILLAVPLAAHAQSMCIAAPQPSTESWVKGADKPPSGAPMAMPVVHTEGLLPHQGIRDQSGEAKHDWNYMRNLALAWKLAG